MARLMGWKDKLILIGELCEILRVAEPAKRLTSQQKKRSTIILKKLKYAHDPKSAPLNRR